MLVVNNSKYANRAEIIWEKGTNRSQFFRGEVDKYGWVDIGSSFLPSEIVSAFLYAQLEELNNIQAGRIAAWDSYYNGLSILQAAEKFSYHNCPIMQPIMPTCFIWFAITWNSVVP